MVQGRRRAGTCGRSWLSGACSLHPPRAQPGEPGQPADLCTSGAPLSVMSCSSSTLQTNSSESPRMVLQDRHWKTIAGSGSVLIAIAITLPRRGLFPLLSHSGLSLACSQTQHAWHCFLMQGRCDCATVAVLECCGAAGVQTGRRQGAQHNRSCDSDLFTSVRKRGSGIVQGPCRLHTVQCTTKPKKKAWHPLMQAVAGL